MADAATPQASALEQPRFWTLDRVADALGDGPRGADGARAHRRPTRAPSAPGELLRRAQGRDVRRARLPRRRRGEGRGGARRAAMRDARAGSRRARVRRRRHARRARRARALSPPRVGQAGRRRRRHERQDEHEGAAARRARQRARACTRRSGNYNNLVGVPLTLFAHARRRRHRRDRDGDEPARRGRARCARSSSRTSSSSRRSPRSISRGSAISRACCARKSAACDGVPLAVVPASQPEVVDAARARAHARRSARASMPATCAPSRVGDRAGRAGLARARRRARCACRCAACTTCATRCSRSPSRASWASRSTRRGARHRGDAGAADARELRAARHARRVINDAYNSNPGSARAALELLEHAGAGRQRVAVLGTMLELGAQADRLHDESRARRSASPIELVVGVGEFADALARVAPGRRARRRRRRSRSGVGSGCVRASLRTPLSCSRVRAASGSSGSFRSISEWASRHADAPSHARPRSTTGSLALLPAHPARPALPRAERLQLHHLPRGRRGGDGDPAQLHRRPMILQAARQRGELPGRARGDAGLARREGERRRRWAG